MNTETKQRLEQLYHEYKNTVFGIALHSAPTPSGAEDVVSEAFLRLMTNGPYLADCVRVKAWLIRVTLNLCHDIRKSARVKRTVDADDEFLASIPTPLTSEEKELWHTVRSLKEKYSIPLLLFYREGYKCSEMSGNSFAERKNGEKSPQSWEKASENHT